MELSELQSRVSKARPNLILRRARLFARINRPSQLIDGESYAVDLTEPSFEVLWGGEPASHAYAQAIATYHDGEWLWGFENESFSEIATAELSNAMHDSHDLSTILRTRKFEIDESGAHDLADWIAQHLGFEAMYPAQIDNTTVFLALNFVSHHGAAAAEGQVWCIGCGEVPARLTHTVVAGPEGRALCKSCATNPLHVLEDHLSNNPDLLNMRDKEPVDAPLAEYVCAFCCLRRKRIMLPETAICFVCLERCKRAFA